MKIMRRFSFGACLAILLLVCAAVNVQAAPAAAGAAQTGSVSTFQGPAQAVSLGSTHTCAINSNGGVVCWGGNEFGQLGDGSTTDSLTPVAVVGLSSGVAAISAGNRHTCALTTGGGVKCWGNNMANQLSRHSNPVLFSAVPLDIEPLTSGVIAISAGRDHNCALTSSGVIRCWGDNTYGQVGVRAFQGGQYPPWQVTLNATGAAISAGSWHTCALTTSGGIKCWGGNNYGQLGHGTLTDTDNAIYVTGLTSGVSALGSATNHICAILTGGELRCWGMNFSGQLGDGTTVHAATPVAALGLGGAVQQISAGGSFSCALVNHLVKCWGKNEFGQLGNASTENSLQPVVVHNLPLGAVAVDSGPVHACAITRGGAIKCWGNNQYGQLGDGSTSASLVPVEVVGFEEPQLVNLYLPAVNR